ncbi:RTC4-like domain-containing protein [Mycotypha africana]|uniref:RTC4-like domain-containing protein n=1 Tax=Mycotypha africana TaxID=64632 RepID=UPI0023014F20|nr:RTC4-like domain-containing protein [Mycotypha africana]KAI8970263.1 RTC4-like domain-containing protein [Mycotypha africana]
MPTKVKRSTNPFSAKSSDQDRSRFKTSRVLKTIDDDDDDDDFQQKDMKFKLPDKKKSLSMKSATSTSLDEKSKTEKLAKSKAILENLNKVEEEMDDNKKKVICPYCMTVLEPITDALEKALEKMKRKDEDYEQRQENQASSSFTCFNIVIKRPVSNEEKDAFCKLHKKELVIKPEGVKKRFPTTIDFNAVSRRIMKFRSELERVIKNELKSEYREIAESAYEEQGISKARSTMSMMARFEASLPGYYGPKGAGVILNTLNDMFLKSGYLSKYLVSQQLPVEFLQQVLVPEVGFRLIREDLLKNQGLGRPMENATEKAKQIMRESCEYGHIMFPSENQHIDSEQQRTVI